MIDSSLSVVLVVASTRPQRFADVLVSWLVPLLEQHGWFELTVVDLVKVNLPTELVAGGAPTDVSGNLAAADAFVVLTPEYNHGYPAQLKHFLDLHYAEWARKPVTFVSYGAGSGGVHAVEQLRSVFTELRATTTRNIVALSNPSARVRSDGRFVPGPGTEDALEATLTELRWWAETLRTGRLAIARPEV